MKKCFLTGLVTLLPLAVTIWALKFILGLLTRPFMGLMTKLLKELPDYWVFTNGKAAHLLSTILILFSILFITFFLGFFARRFFFDKLLKLGDKILGRIPLVNKIYKTSKEIVQSLFSGKQQLFKQVVLLPFPYKGSYCLGLISRESPQTFTDASGREMQSVYIPTTPNPTTGFLVMVPREELVFLEMTSEEAMKYVISCAAVRPKGASK